MPYSLHSSSNPHPKADTGPKMNLNILQQDARWEQTFTPREGWKPAGNPAPGDAEKYTFQDGKLKEIIMVLIWNYLFGLYIN